MRHVLEDPAGLSPRAVRFLAEAGERTSVDRPDGPAADDLRSALPGVDAEQALRTFNHASARYGGLRYRSVSWSFDQTISFDPVPWAPDDYGPEDRDAMADLIVYEEAQPFATWLRGDGVVLTCLTGSDQAPLVPIFPGVGALLEAEALYRDCATWIPVPLDDAPSLPAVEAHLSSLTLKPEAHGYTEGWWERDGFRLHIWKTYAAVLPGSGVRWAVWARDRSGERAARSFLAQAARTLPSD